jgi:hypothetical protein
LDGTELLRNARVPLGGVVDDHRHQESFLLRRVAGALDRQPPFTTKVAFEPRLGMSGIDRYEQCAVDSTNYLVDGHAGE